MRQSLLDPVGKRRLDRLVRQDETQDRESRAKTWLGEEKEEGRRKKKESERGR